MTATPSPDAPCPCKSGKSFGACCGPYLAGTALAPTAEALMRARYCAFATGQVDFLAESLLPGTGDDFDRAAAIEWSGNSEWTGLSIRMTEAGGPADDEGFVEFVAHFRQKGEDLIHHETGRFVKQDGRWYYADGATGQRPRHAEKIGRNDPCPCGSGKKYKKCCGARA
jgi:SEC-C motif-containing protein